mmetsp:Transcript_48816/g.153249  ORF Transcript_48816/g.153249 Transcript_48816/m.153249 type:complete len:142 (-) Transcript_48816:1577-2002(-)
MVGRRRPFSLSHPMYFFSNDCFSLTNGIPQDPDPKYLEDLTFELPAADEVRAGPGTCQSDLRLRDLGRTQHKPRLLLLPRSVLQSSWHCLRSCRRWRRMRSRTRIGKILPRSIDSSTGQELMLLVGGQESSLVRCGLRDQR